MRLCNHGGRKKKKMRTKLGLMILGIFLIAGCMNCDSETNNDFSGRVVINEEGRKIYVECKGAGVPLVMFVAGLQDSAETWNKIEDPSEQTVFSAIAEGSRVCVYDRPGTIIETGPGVEDFERSRSDPVMQPITPANAAQDLHDLLSVIGEPGPHILVGHSAGGTFSLHYASLFPEDVSGLVLIDYLPYKIRNHELMTTELWEIWKKANTLPEFALDLYPDIERLDHEPSSQQLIAAPPLKPLSLIVLSATELPAVGPLVDAGLLTQEEAQALVAVLQDVLLDTRGDLVSEVPGAEHVTDTNSGHFIHQEQPELVVEQIRKVLEAVRNGCASLACK
ncbi:MAG: alpha/beta hydrolase [Thermodesulfobacteriota bacterium]